MQHQLTTIRSGKTSPGASLQNFHFPFLSRLFHVLFRARVLLLLVCFFCQLFPSGDFLGIFFFLRFHFWSWFRDLFFLIFVNSCCCYTGILCRRILCLLLHLTYYFIACKKIILKTLKSVRGASETACRLLSLCKHFHLPR